MALQQLGRYSILRVIGKGAMGLVYEGHDPNINRPVAIKTIRLDECRDDMAAEYEERFQAEARAAGRLHHPNIVGVYDAGSDAGMAYLVMELVLGDDLKTMLEGGRRYPLGPASRMMSDLLSALDYAHGLGIVHRDIKPANVMIDREGHVRLTDFGVARLCDPGDPTTSHGTIVGTPKYMSPEQIRGERVDGRSDLFSAGVLLYQMLTGLRPFDAPGDFGVWQQICSEKQQPASSINPDLPPDIDDVLDKALAKRREDRYRSAREFALALRLVARAGRIASSASSQPISAPLLLPAPAAIGASGPPSLPPKPAGSNSLTMELELLYWKEIRDSDDPADFHTFLRKFEDGIYAHLARRRLRWLTHVGGDDSKGDASDRSSLPPLSDQGLRGATGALDWWPDETSTDDGLPP